VCVRVCVRVRVRVRVCVCVEVGVCVREREVDRMKAKESPSGRYHAKLYSFLNQAGLD